MKSAVFLDIDGVLNNQEQWGNPYSLNEKCIKAFCDFINGYRGQTEIILISSWRNGFDTKTRTNSIPQLKNLDEKLAKYGVRVFDAVPSNPEKTRFQLIDYYLRRHAYDSYVIVDDDPGEYPEGLPERLCLINEKTGFTAADGKKCLKILKTH